MIHSSPIYTLFLNRSGVIQKPVFRLTQLLVAVLLLIKYRFWERGGERICVWPQIRNLSDYNRIRIHNHLVRKWTLNHSVKLIKWSTLWVCICMVHLTVCSYHVTYAFQSESKLNSCVHVKELLAQNRCNIWSLSDWNGIWIPNHLVINEHSIILPNWPNDWVVLLILICTIHLIACSHHTMLAFQCASTLYNCLNLREILARIRHDI